MKKFLIGLMVAVFAVTAFFAAGCSKSEEITGTLYSLETAYENGWLTQDDLMSIAYYHNGGRIGNEEIMLEDYQPAPIDPESLSIDIETAIKKTLWYDYHDEDNPDKESIEMITIKNYLGSYHGYYVVILNNPFAYSPAVIRDEWVEISDVKIHYIDHNNIKVWQEKI